MVERHDYSVKELAFVVQLEFVFKFAADEFKETDIPKRYRHSFELLDGTKRHRYTHKAPIQYMRTLQVKPNCISHRISLIDLKNML